MLAYSLHQPLHSLRRLGKSHCASNSGRGVFGASHRCTKSEVSTRGIGVWSSVRWTPGRHQVFEVHSCLQDLANQIKHWEVYTAEVAKRGIPLGSCLNPEIAEWFSGSHLSLAFLLMAFQCCLIRDCFHVLW